jgi:putative methyltransferase (TIGR04325 family)
MLRRLIKKWTPPAIIQAYRRINPVKSGYSGDYSSWKEALKNSTGYNSSDILKKVEEAAIKVKNGEAAFERDSIIFNEIEYNFHLQTSLLIIANQNQGSLNIIDYGGSLGSTYFQNRNILEILRSVRWNVIEQNNFVKSGKKYFETNELKFYFSISECFEETSPNGILFSCTLPYLPEPYQVLEEIVMLQVDFIIISEMPFNYENRDRLTIQKVPDTIYKASYPCWLLNKQKILELLSTRYQLINSSLSKHSNNLSNKRIQYENFLFKLKR